VRTETYRSADLDATGQLRITTSDGRTIIVAKEGEQRAFSDPVLAPDRTAVGVQADYTNCCTSYDVPLELVVYSNGETHRFNGKGLAIFEWQFVANGAQIAYRREPLHNVCVASYELRDVQSEQLIDSADVPQSCGQFPASYQAKIPAWVRTLDERHKHPDP
jgi:hypothetical protein